MAKNQSKVGENKSDVIRELPAACSDEAAAVAFFEKHRWGDEPCCPHCGDTAVYQMVDRKTGLRNRRFLWRCRGCNKQFSVKVGSVMEDSRIPLRHWAFALWQSCASKKGVSAKQIQRQTGLSYKSALFLLHRIRWGMAPTGNGPKLTGTVEVDETQIGGKPRYRIPHDPLKRPGRPKHKPKPPVFGAIQRGGPVRTWVIPDVTAHTLRQAVEEHVDKAARLMSDEHRGYISVGKEYAAHDVVKHSSYEYVRGDVTTNTIESFWAILKRGIFGVYHNVSRKHLQRYLDEFEFRFNSRDMDDGERTVAAIQGAVGKRLTYCEPVH